MITGHGAEVGNRFPMNKQEDKTKFDFNDIFNPLNKALLDELKRIMAPGGTIEFRMCEGVKGQLGKNNAQAIADATRCVVKAYSMKVNMFGTFVKHLFTVYGRWSFNIHFPWKKGEEKFYPR